MARQAFDEATRELEAGTRAQDRQQEGGRFGTVGLHLLLGLVRLARGEESGAEEELARELTFESAGHIYTSQACAATWSAIGALRLARSRTGEAVAAFTQALEHVPGHLSALAAMCVVADRAGQSAPRAQVEGRLAELRRHGALVEAAIAAGIVDALEGRPDDAAARVLAALQATPDRTSAGWTIPIEPLLRIPAAPEAWAPVLALLRNRAA